MNTVSLNCIFFVRKKSKASLKNNSDDSIEFIDNNNHSDEDVEAPVSHSHNRI